MRTIHKFRGQPPSGRNAGEFLVEMPRNADILCVKVQDGTARVWAIVEDDAKAEMRRVVVVGTGWPLPADMGRGEYIGTYQTDGFVWHVFAAKPNALSGEAK
jgi:hypothetical protein